MICPPGNICQICGAEWPQNIESIVLIDRRKGLSGNWSVVQCNHCGIGSLVPPLADEDLEHYYAAYSSDDRVDLTPQVGTRYPGFRRFFHLISGDVDPRDFLQVAGGARVLDYGCGRAGYLVDFHAQGISIIGAEISQALVTEYRNQGYDVCQVVDFSKIPFEDQSFEVVYLMQVFEHLRAPHAFLEELSRILTAEGTLYLALPNAASAWRKVFGTNWVSGWFAPFHLFHYDRQALAKIANEHGFELIESWSSTPESWFRLNLKAFLYPKENQLEWRSTWLDTLPMRLILMLFLRLIEVLLRERDCLVLRFKKSNRNG